MSSTELRRRLRNQWRSCRSRASDLLAGALVALLIASGGSSLVAQQTGSGVFPIPGPFTGGGSFSGQLRAPATPTDCSAPGYSFQGDTDTGDGYGSANEYFACAGGQKIVSFNGASTPVVTVSRLAFGIGQGDVLLERDGAANVLAQRNSTNAQTFRVYGTFTDSGNYERLSVITAAGTYGIYGQVAGTGVSRNLEIGVPTGSEFRIVRPGVSVFWAVPSASGHLLAGADNTFDIGASGSRPRAVEAATYLYSGNYVESTNDFRFTGSSRLTNTSDGVVLFRNGAGTGFTRLIFGTNDTSGVSLKKNGTAINVRLGDDSADAPLTASQFSSNAYVLSTLAASATAPTVSSAGTSPSVPNNNGTLAFRVNVGTGGTATTIVMTMPAAAGGWNCDAQNITANAANRANQHVVQQSSTTTSATVQNQTISTGAALAFAASDIVRFICFAY